MLFGLGDVTGQCAAGLNPNYDENGNLLSCTEGSSSAPNCIAGESVVTFDDGSYGCSTGVTAQSIGVAAPDCGGGSPYLDGNGDWGCTAPVQQTSGGAGPFLVAAAIAAAVYIYFASKAQKTVKAFSSGDPKQMLGAAGVSL